MGGTEQGAGGLPELRRLAGQGRGQVALRAVRRRMVAEEGWQESHMLPEDWLFKVTVQGPTTRLDPRSGRAVSGVLWSSEVVFLAKDLTELHSQRAVKEHMDQSPRYNFEDITNFRAFIREDGTTAEALLRQIRDSVEVAPWGLKKYKSNQKPGAQRPRKSNVGRSVDTRGFFQSSSKLVQSTRSRTIHDKKEDWSDEDTEDEISYEHDKEDDQIYDIKTEIKENVEAKPRVKSKYLDYQPGWMHVMKPNEKVKIARSDLNMIRVGRRPFVEIIKEEKTEKETAVDLTGIKRKYDEIKTEHSKEDAATNVIPKCKRSKTARNVG
jgi:hypothetical protein